MGLLGKQCAFGLLLCLASAGTSRLHADESSSGPRITLEAKSGVAVGTARELVFYPSDTGYDPEPDYLSELRWDLKPAVLVGCRLGVELPRGGRYHFDVQTALPIRSGFMEDRDWMYWNRSDITHYSLHEITIDTALILDAGGAWKIASPGGWDISLTTGYHLDYWDWTDALVKYQHVSFSEIREYTGGTDPLIEDFPVLPGDGGDSIHYRTAYHVLYAGVRAGYAAGAFSLDAGLVAGPVFASAWDHHFNKGIYHDWGFGGPWTSADIGIVLEVGKSGAVVLDAEFIWMFEFKGRTYVYTESMIFTGESTSRPGFQFRRFTGSAGYRFRF